MEHHNDYHFSFFKPTTPNARRNRNIIVQFFLIWAVSIFGFQILLKVLEKPTPEHSYVVFQQHWPVITQDEPDKDALRHLSHSVLAVLGKIDVKPDYRNALNNGLSWMSWRIADSSQKEDLMLKVVELESEAAATGNILDESYIAKKNEVADLLGEILMLGPEDVRRSIAPLEVHSFLFEEFSPEARTQLEAAMNFYLIHNQSFLTDMKFLGFPFHYFYTAVFLLILFVGLCLLYCIRTDVFHRKYGITD
jgi:putative solute:sodium symporter small subunit